MRNSAWWMMGALSFATAATAQPLGADGLTMPQFQGRVRLGMSVPASPLDAGTDAGIARLSAASVLGDYYFVRSSPQAAETFGFRVTSGVLLGSRAGSWGGPALAAPGGSAFMVETHRFSLASSPALPSGDTSEDGTVPYLGVGYSLSSVKSGWGFSADLGLMALNPRGVAGFGRGLGAGGPSLEDTLRDIRLSPILQLGVSYSF